MKKKRPFYLPIIASLSISLLSVNVYSEPANLDILRKKVEAYHDSGAYLSEINAVTSRARHFINQRVAHNRQLKHPQKLAIVLDIDETSLSNYFNMVPRQFVASKEQLIKELHAANLQAIKPVLALYRDALAQGVDVFFVTGRREPDRASTYVNLKHEGFKHWTGIYFKPDSYQKKSAIPYKTHARADITKKGYTIIASIGDQCSDLKGGYMEAGFKLPNPYYYLP